MSVEIIAVGRVNFDLRLKVDSMPKRGEHRFSKGMISTFGGSAANFATQMAQLGVKTGLVGCVGSDKQGKVIMNNLMKRGVDVSRVQVLQSQITGLFLLITDANDDKYIITEMGANKFIDRLDRRVIDEDYLIRTRVVHIAGGFPNMIDMAIELTSTEGIIFSFDPGRAADDVDFSSVIKHTDLLFVNQKELAKYCKISPTKNEMIDFAKQFPGILILKQGAKGATATDGIDYYHSDAFDVPVVDTLGAGDAFAAGFVLAWTRCENIELALNFANATAALTITQRGAQQGQPGLDQVAKLLEDYSISADPILRTFRERKRRK